MKGRLKTIGSFAVALLVLTAVQARASIVGTFYGPYPEGLSEFEQSLAGGYATYDAGILSVDRSSASGGNITVTFKDDAGVSGVGVLTGGAAIVSVTLFGDYQAPEVPAGAFAYTTDLPDDVFINQVVFSGVSDITGENFNYGRDSLRRRTVVPEPSTYVAGLTALGILGLRCRRCRK